MWRTTAGGGLPGMFAWFIPHCLPRYWCKHRAALRVGLGYRPNVSSAGAPGPRSPGRSSSIALIVAAHLVASLAAAMLLVVLAVAAFEASGPAGVAILTIVQLVPTLVVVPLVSRTATARTRRRALLAAQVTGMLGAGALGLALLADTGTLVVYLLAAVSAASTTTAWAMTVAWLPALAASPGQLVASNAACMAAEGVGGLAGPLLAAAAPRRGRAAIRRVRRGPRLGRGGGAHVAHQGSLGAPGSAWHLRPRRHHRGWGGHPQGATAGLAVLGARPGAAPRDGRAVRADGRARARCRCSWWSSPSRSSGSASRASGC